MNTIIIKSNEELFNRWKEATYVLRNLSSIVQNDIEITEQEWKEWLTNLELAKSALDTLGEDTITWKHLG